MFRKADFDEDGYVNEDDFYNIVSRRVYDEEPQKNDTKMSQKAMSTSGKRSSRFWSKKFEFAVLFIILNS